MKILVITDITKEGNTGSLVVSTLMQMGHDIATVPYVMDDRLKNEPFDMTLTWTNNYPNPDYLPGIKVAYYLDDPTWWLKHNINLLPENCTKGYNHVFTCNDLR